MEHDQRERLEMLTAAEFGLKALDRAAIQAALDRIKKLETDNAQLLVALQREARSE